MNPLLIAALVLSLCVIVCWGGANLIKWKTARARRQEDARRGGLIDFSRRRL